MVKLTIVLLIFADMAVGFMTVPKHVNVPEKDQAVSVSTQTYVTPQGYSGSWNTNQPTTLVTSTSSE